MVQAIASKADFDAQLSAAGSKAVLVDFHATWCGPCKMIAPKLQNFSDTYSNVVVLKVDVDEVGELAEKYEVKAMPTFIVIKDGVQVDTMMGADPTKLEALFKQYN